MTQILCDIRDSRKQPLTGYIQVTLSADIEDGAQNYLAVPSIVALVNGMCTLDLEDSEDDRTTYHFEIYQGVPPNATSVKSFYATVPDSATPIPLTDLVPTGLTRDIQDASLAAIARRLYNSDTFWDRFTDQVFMIKGNWVVGTYYSRGNIVYHQGGSYLYINRLGSAGNEPVPDMATQYWHPIAARGQAGSGTAGSLSLYSAIGWLNSNQAVSQHAVRDIVENVAAKKATVDGLAPILNAVMSGLRIQTDPGQSDRSSLVPSTQWVQTLADTIRKAVNPVGVIQAWSGTSAPTGWLLCDGRVLSRTTFADLFAVIGTTYNLGGEPANQFRIPDLRGRMPLGLDSMSALQGAAGRVPGLTLLGTPGGSATRTLTVTELPSHDHGGVTGTTTGLSQGYYAGGGSTSGFQFSSTLATNFPQNPAPGSHTHPITAQGGGQPFSIMNPYQGLMYIIYAGL